MQGRAEVGSRVAVLPHVQEGVTSGGHRDPKLRTEVFLCSHWGGRPQDGVGRPHRGDTPRAWRSLTTAPTSCTGEYVREPCSRPHTRGQCEKCDSSTFTAFPNGLGSCLLCGTCSQGESPRAPCLTVTRQPLDPAEADLHVGRRTWPQGRSRVSRETIGESGAFGGRREGRRGPAGQSSQPRRDAAGAVRQPPRRSPRSVTAGQWRDPESPSGPAFSAPCLFSVPVCNREGAQSTVGNWETPRTWGEAAGSASPSGGRG